MQFLNDCHSERQRGICSSGENSRSLASARDDITDLVLAILRIYKRWISPLLPSACRFHPTCSEYMMQAIERHGVWRGTRMGVLRLLRCHPFHQGGFDPVR